jgi:membrane protein YdbS with pleckstrin-like domain
MEPQNALYTYLLQLSMHIPAIIIYVIGIGFALFNSAKHPKISILSITAFVILLISTFFSGIIPLLTPYLYSSGSYDIKTISYIFFFIGFTFSLFTAISFGLLIAATWKDRK